MCSGSSLVKLFLAALICFTAVVAVRADEDKRRFLYQWTDNQGGMHVTDDVQKIPQKYRSRATQMRQPDVSDGSTGGAAQQRRAAEDRDDGSAGANEEMKKAEWQQRMIDAKLRLQFAETKVGQLEDRKRELQAQWGSAGAALPTQEAMDEMKRVSTELSSAKVEVDKARDVVNNVIPDEARRAGIPPGWLREVE